MQTAQRKIDELISKLNLRNSVETSSDSNHRENHSANNSRTFDKNFSIKKHVDWDNRNFYFIDSRNCSDCKSSLKIYYDYENERIVSENQRYPELSMSFRIITTAMLSHEEIQEESHIKGIILNENEANPFEIEENEFVKINKRERITSNGMVDDEKVTVRIFKLEKEIDCPSNRDIFYELSVLKRLSSIESMPKIKEIIALRHFDGQPDSEYKVFEDYLIVISDYLGSVSLWQYINRLGVANLTEESFADIAANLILDLSDTIEKGGVLLRAVNPFTISFDDAAGRFRFFDFSNAEIFDKDKSMDELVITGSKGIPWFMAPEHFARTKSSNREKPVTINQSIANDIYSLGKTLVLLKPNNQFKLLFSLDEVNSGSSQQAHENNELSQLIIDLLTEESPIKRLANFDALVRSGLKSFCKAHHSRAYPQLMNHNQSTEKSLLFQGKVYMILGDIANAQRVFAQCKALFSQNDDIPNTIKATELIGETLYRSGKIQEAQQQYLEALQQKINFIGSDDHPNISNTLVNLGKCALDNKDPKLANEYLERAYRLYKTYISRDKFEFRALLFLLGLSYRDNQAHEKALNCFNECFQGFYRGKIEKDDIFALNSMQQYAFAFINLQQPEDGVPLLEKHISMIERIYMNKLCDDELSLIKVYTFIGKGLAGMKKYESAIKYFEKVLEIKKNSKIQVDQILVAQTLNNISIAYGELGQNEKSVEISQRALKLFQLINGDNDPSVANCMNNLGLRYIAMENYERGLSLLMRALEIYEKNNENTDMIAKLFNNLGMTYFKMKKIEEAINYCQKALFIYQKDPQKNTLNIANSFNNIGVIYYNQQNFCKAKTYFENSLENKKKVFGDKETTALAETYVNLGNMHFSLKEYEEALPYFAKSIAIAENQYGLLHPSIISLSINIGNCHFYIKGFSMSHIYYEKALELAEKLNADNSRDLQIAEILENIGNLQNTNKKNDEAAQYFERALQIRNKYNTDKNSRKLTLNAMYNLSSFYGNKGDRKKSAMMAQEALKLINDFGENDPELKALKKNIKRSQGLKFTIMK